MSPARSAARALRSISTLLICAGGLLALSACRKESGPAPAPEPGTASSVACYFQGDLKATARLVGPTTSGAVETFRLEWDDKPAPGGPAYAPPKGVRSGQIETFASCAAASASFPTVAAKIAPAGERALTIEVPKGWSAACAGATVKVRMSVSPDGYVAPCASPKSNGFPVYIVEGSFTLDAKGGAVTSSSWSGGRFFEG